MASLSSSRKRDRRMASASGTPLPPSPALPRAGSPTPLSFPADGSNGQPTANVFKRRKSVEVWTNFSFDSLPSPEGTWKLEAVIGRGQYGQVYIASSGETKAAAKIIDTTEDDFYKLNDVRNEVCIMQRYSHPSVVKLYGAYKKAIEVRDHYQIWVVMELCDGGSVSRLARAVVAAGRRLGEDVIGYVLREVLQALVYLHNNGVIHRDIKGSNILLTRQGNVKLADFGVAAKTMSHEVVRRRTSIVGTPHFMAPEVIYCEYQDDLDYDSRCDTWSLGITALQLGEGNPPLSDKSNMEARSMIPKRKAPVFSKPELWSNNFKEFVAKCLIKDMDRRPLCAELVENLFVTKIENLSQVKGSIIGLIQEFGLDLKSGTNTPDGGSFRKRPQNRAQSLPLVLEVSEEPTSPSANSNSNSAAFY
eukprot:m.310749 g.310749  ORF g.310749 m.310749 type:complete len:419 (+) comp54425_c0_seq1:96-1352(+)